MVVKNILNKTSKWWYAISHLGRIGKLASTRSFLLRERKKLIQKLGEKTLELIHQEKIKAHALDRLVEQIEKIDRLIARQDYGGENGVNFDSEGKPSKRKTKE